MATKIKNPIFLKNCTHPENEKIVKSIYFHKTYKPNKHKPEMRTKRDLVWQYYKNRHNKSVEQTLKDFKYTKKEIYEYRIIYSGDPKEYIVPKEDVINKIENKEMC